ncbi:MAG: hypothetical protein K2H33_04590 [Muribaculaceae bacterium]|nr:hypothetical protein [Muribaculaceae bacterium]
MTPTINLNEIAEKAMQILKGHDWYWMMVDSGYSAAAGRAKSNMRYFVETIAGLTEELREAFRILWIATHDYHSSFRPMWTAPDVEERKAAMQAAEDVVKSLMSAMAIAA